MSSPPTIQKDDIFEKIKHFMNVSWFPALVTMLWMWATYRTWVGSLRIGVAFSVAYIIAVKWRAKGTIRETWAQEVARTVGPGVALGALVYTLVLALYHTVSPGGYPDSWERPLPSFDMYGEGEIFE
jgi:hypothetical protein